MSSTSTTPAGDGAAPAPAPAKAAAPEATSAPVASQKAAASAPEPAAAATAAAPAPAPAKAASDAPAASAAPDAAAKAAPAPATDAKPAAAASPKADSAAAAAGSPRRKKLQLNPDVPAFQPSSPLQVHAPTFSPSWAPAVVRNSGLRPPPGVAPKAGGTGMADAAAPGAAPAATTGKKSRRRKRRGRKRGGADGDPRIVKITGLKTGDDVTLLKALLAQLFGPVASFSSGAAKGQKVVLLVTFENADSATKAVRSGSVNHNGVALKLMRQPGTGGSAPSNIVRLSNLPLTTTAESLAKILAKHGARASSSDMQTSPSGEFTGVVFCRYCSTDAAARAVSQLSDSVVEGHTLKATYNVPPTTAAAPQGGNAAAAGGRRQSKGRNAASSAATSSGSPFSGNRRRSNSRGSAGVATPPMPGSSGFTRLVMVPAVPHSGGSARRRRHYSEDWTSRRTSDTPSTRHRTSSFARGSVPEGSEGGSPGGTSTWLKRRARSLSNSAAAPPIPVHYALGPDGSTGFERVRRGRSRSVTAAAAAAAPVANKA